MQWFYFKSYCFKALHRKEDLIRLLEYSEIVIAHDNEDAKGNLYRVQDESNSTLYSFRWEKMDAQTTAVSNTRSDLIDAIKVLVRWAEDELILESI